MTYEEKAHLWQERLQQQKNSGCTISNWCEQHKLSVQTFYYWQKKFATPKKQNKSIIVPLATIAPQSPIVVETPAGYRVSITDESALHFLPQLLKILP